MADQMPLSCTPCLILSSTRSHSSYFSYAREHRAHISTPATEPKISLQSMNRSTPGWMRYSRRSAEPLTVSPVRNLNTTVWG